MASPRLPAYWSVLDEKDKRGYVELRRTISPLSLRTDRRELAARFRVLLSRIHSYCLRQDEDDWKRCLVCGVAWVDGGVALNTRQLCVLFGKCRSSISSGLHAVGYGAVSGSADAAASLLRLFPFLKGKCAEMRQWTIRARDRDDAGAAAEADDDEAAAAAKRAGFDERRLAAVDWREFEAECGEIALPVF